MVTNPNSWKTRDSLFSFECSIVGVPSATLTRKKMKPIIFLFPSAYSHTVDKTHTHCAFCLPLKSELRTRNDVTFNSTTSLLVVKARWTSPVVVVSIINQYQHMTANYVMVYMRKQHNSLCTSRRCTVLSDTKARPRGTEFELRTQGCSSFSEFPT